MKTHLFKLFGVLGLFFLISKAANSQHVFVEGSVYIANDENVEILDSLTLGTGSDLYIEDTANIIFYGGNFKMEPSAKVYGVNPGLPLAPVQGNGTGVITFFRNPLGPLPLEGQTLDCGNSSDPANSSQNTLTSIVINNPAGVKLINSDARIGTNLSFVNGHIITDDNDLTLGPAATITAADAAKFVVTNATGRLIKENTNTTPFIFPVGFEEGSFNPLSVTQNQQSEDIGVRCKLHALRDGLTGPPLVKDVVDASWVITESVVGQNDLTLTAEWTNGDEPLYFNRKFCGISYYAPAGWDLTVPMLSLATGTDPYQVSRTSVSEVGVFAVGNRAVSKPLRANAKIFLQGAYDAITHNMYATLWLFQLIPKNSPYSDSTNFKSTIKNYWKYFALLGPGSESIDSLLLYADPPSSPNPKVVDWVLAHLHRTSDQAVVATKAVFVKQDGQIVDTDGTGAFIDGINFEGVPEGNYYLSIRHRNHLGLRSQDILSLTSILPPAYNLTDTTKIFKGANYTVDLVAAQLEPNSNIYGAYAGNVVPNRDIVYNNTDNDNAELLNILQGNKAGRKSGYLNADVNMNGTARYNGSANDNAVMLSIVLKGNYAGRRRQPYLDVVIANPPF